MSASALDTPRRRIKGRRPWFYTPSPAIQVSIAQAGLGVQHNQRAQLANLELGQGAFAINQLGRQFNKVSDPILAGRVAEQVHASTFNSDAIMKGRPEVKAQTTATNGGYHDSADIHIYDGGKQVANPQLKYRGDAKSTATGLADAKYTGQQRVAPSDQIDGIHQEFRRRIAKDGLNHPQRANDFRDAQARTSVMLEHDGIKSQPLGRNEAVEIAKRARHGEAKLSTIPERPIAKVIARASVDAAIQAAAIGGTMSAIASGVQNARAYQRGEKHLRGALKDTIVDAGIGLTDSGAKAFIGTALKSGAAVVASAVETGTLRTVAKRAAGSNVLCAVAAVFVDAGVGIVRVFRGQITVSEYGKRLGESGTSTGIGWAMAEVGGSLGTLIAPGPGTMIGALFGGIIGGVGGNSLGRLVFRRKKKSANNRLLVSTRPSPFLGPHLDQ